MSDAPLVLVSNRGPVTFGPDGEVKRGGGGLVTALTGLASHREAVWIASAMTDEDVDEGRGERRAAVRGRVARRAARTTCGSSRPTPTPTTASTTSSRTRCCGSSSTTSGTSRTRRTSAATRSRRSSTATTSSTRTSRAAVCEEIEGVDEPVVMVHDYHLYTLPGARAPRAARRVPAPLRPHPVDPARRVARAAARHPARDLRGPPGQRHRRLPHALVPLELPAVLPRPDGPRGRLRRAAIVHFEDREVWVRAYPLPIDARATLPRRGVATATAEFEDELLAPPARAPDPARRPRRPVEERPARLLAPSTCSSSSTRSSPRRSRSSRSSCRRGPTCRSTPSTWSASRRSSRSSTTATARRTGCRSSSSCATTSRRRWPPTSTTTCCSSTRCSTG